MSRDTFRLDPRQVEFAEKFLSSREPANHVLLGPVGSGKSVVASLLIREIVDRGRGPVLVVAPLTEGRFLAQQTVDAGAHFLELSKARLREVESYVDSGFLSRGVAAVSSRILDDGWTREVLGRVPWGLIVVEGDSVSSTEIDVLASLIAETRASALVLADAPTVERRFEAFGDLVVTAWLTDQYQSDEPPADLSSRFRLRPFSRDESEWALLERVQDVLRDVGSLASPLGLSSLEAAAASSHFALQTKALRSLERLRSQRNMAAHGQRPFERGRADERATDLATQASVVTRAYEGLEEVVRMVDALPVDTKYEALLDEVGRLKSGHRGLAIFTGVAATADYLTKGLGFIRERVISVRARGTEQRHLDAFLDEPGSIVVAHDAVLKGLDLSQATAALNYDVSPDRRRMHIRWSRLDWRDPSLPPEVVTLQPSPMLPREERAFSKMPYLAGDSDLL